LWKWLQEVLHGKTLSKTSRSALFAASDGYGWYYSQSTRLGETVYASNGRGAGFSSRMEYLPDKDITIIALTNIEHDANPMILPEVAALLLRKPHQSFQYDAVPPALIGHPTGDFVFGPDFYRSSATLSLVSDANGVTLNWPGGPVAPLLPIGRDKFIDRYYWTNVTIVRGKDGNPAAMEYGKFRGVLRAAPK
jgi:CubicO group peptidase (beta-lactamase class C family)